MKLLCAADLHLGRQPSRLPAALQGSAQAAELTPAAAWHRLVDLAIELEVDGVLLAGDVVDQRDDFFEAYADLRAGVERLAQRGIAVLGVAGNHDVAVLPRLARAVEGFTLLGAGGEWEVAHLTGRGGATVRVLGWSFPEERVTTNPLAAGLPDLAGPEPVIGLLHCDLDSSGGPYAPVRSTDLAAQPVTAWLLGHVHKPSLTPTAQPLGYLGSLTGNDPGEPGARGAWLLELAPGRDPAVRHLPLSPLRWEELVVPLDDLAAPEEVRDLILRALDELDERLQDTDHRPAAVGCRLRLVGRTRFRNELPRVLHAADPRDATHPRGSTTFFIHDWRLEALPDLDLAALARSTDPAGLLARRLLTLRAAEEDEARRALLEGARERLQPVPQGRPFGRLARPPLSDDALADLLETAALRALDALLAQRQGAA